MASITSSWRRGFAQWGAPLLLGLALSISGAAAWADPPAQTGRISWLAGPVNLRSASAPDGSPDTVDRPAQLNWPLTTGDVLSTGPTGRTEVWIGSTALRLNVGTRVSFDQLDEQRLAVRVEQGSIALRVATPEAARSSVVETPFGQFRPDQPGEMRIDVPAPGANPVTSASAWQGALIAQAGATSLTVRPGQRVDVSPAPNGSVQVTTSVPIDDDFAHFVRNRDGAFAGRTAARYVSPEMTGVETLDNYGHWSQVAEYGAVWWPTVAPGWVPYRTGHWAQVGPWGWTWIADEPWGFAPFHYGRWVLWEGRWGWVPGTYVARPVYAPALVGWVGAPGAAVSVHAAFGPAVGWYPLAPREVFVPTYVASPTYVRNVNVTHVTNITNITNVTNVTSVNNVNGAVPQAAAQPAHRYRGDAAAMTVVPSGVMTAHQPVAGHVMAASALALPPRAQPTAEASPPRPATDPMAERRNDRNVDRSADRNPDRTADRSMDHNPDRKGDRAPGQPMAAAPRPGPAPAVTSSAGSAQAGAPRPVGVPVGGEHGRPREAGGPGAVHSPAGMAVNMPPHERPLQAQHLQPAPHPHAEGHAAEHRAERPNEHEHGPQHREREER